MQFRKRIHINGEKKIVTKFLWFPVTINYIDHYEIRWLEKATIEYKYEDNWAYSHWIPNRFI